MDELEKPSLFVTYEGSVWDLVGAALISTRDEALQEELKDDLRRALNEEDIHFTLRRYIDIVEYKGTDD